MWCKKKKKKGKVTANSVGSFLQPLSPLLCGPIMRRTAVCGGASRSHHCHPLGLGTVPLRTVTFPHFGARYRSLQAGAVLAPKEQIGGLESPIDNFETCVTNPFKSTPRFPVGARDSLNSFSLMCTLGNVKLPQYAIKCHLFMHQTYTGVTK